MSSITTRDKSARTGRPRKKIKNGELRRTILTDFWDKNGREH